MYLLLFTRSLTKKITAVLVSLVLAASLLVGLVTAVTSSETAVTPQAVPDAAPVNAPPVRLDQPAQSAESGRLIDVDIVPRTVSPARSVTSYDWGDVDGDGDLDLAVGTYRQGNRVYLNQNGDFSQLAWTDTMTDNNTAAIAWGDVDGDGDLDLAVGLSNAPNRLYLNENGRLQTTPAWTDNLNDPTSDLLWGDMDGDGYLDLVVANRGTANKIFINTGDGLLAETAAWEDPGRYDLTTSLDLADVDQDGDLDIVFGNYVNDRPFDPTGLIPAEDYYARLYRNRLQETGRLQLDRDWVGGNAVSDVAWGDVDGDQYPELALVDFWNWGNDGVYMNTAGNLAISSEWRPRSAVEYYQIRLGYSVAWGDVDNDGDLDLAMGFSTDTRERIYLNNGGSLADTPAWESSSFERAFHIGWADVDGDGNLDLTVIYAGQVNVYTNHAQSLSPQDALLENGQRPSTLAWGDMDNDGDLDLAVGTGYGFELQGGVNTIYRQDGSGFSPIDLDGRSDQTTGLAWGDVNGDGWLDLAVGNYLGANLVYLNQNGTISAAGPVIDLGGREATTAVAWGDVNGDGHLDLVVGNNGTANRLYLNTGSGITATQFITFGAQSGAKSGAQSATLSLAWGDVDGDGDLDLAVGNAGQPNQLYFNDQGRLSDERVQTFGGAENSAGLAWGDVNGDGNLDLVVGNAGSANQLYLNAGGRLAEQPAWTSGDLDDTRSVALGDVDGDGDLDLAAANASGEQGAAPQPNKLYLNENGRLQTITDHPWTTRSDEPSYAAAWNDVDGDGDLDLTFASRFGLQFYINDSRQVHPARAAAAIELAPDASPVTLPDGTQNTILAPGGFYGAAGIRENGRITFAYTLTHPANRPVPAVGAFYSPDGGGRWLTAVPITGTQTTNLATTPGQNRHTFTWDVFGSGLFGQSNNVVFRLEAYETIPGEQAAAPGTFLYTNQRAGMYQRPYLAATTLPFRVRGNQIRVFQEAALPENAVAQAIIYQLPANSSSGGAPLTDLSGEPYRTDALGYLQGRSQLITGTQLVALWPVPTTTYPFTFTNRAALYTMSAVPITRGLQTDSITSLDGVLSLTVTANHPLILFDLVVSLEWDASGDQVFMEGLREGFRRASEILFDVSNGQVALRNVHVFHAKAHWNDADVIILANNGIRPSAAIGGVVNRPLTETVLTGSGGSKLVPNAYLPGQIRMGPAWDPFGENTAELSADWWQALAHELSHYLFFLPDDYLGLENNVLRRIDCPGSFMTTTRDPGYTEFLTRSEWEARPNCLNTLAEKTTGRANWQTITRFYPILQPPDAALRFAEDGVVPAEDGPVLLPLNVMRLFSYEFSDGRVPLPTRIFDVRDAVKNERTRLPAAQVYLFQTQGTITPTDDILVYLGAPTGGGDRIKVRGAFPGDRVCLFDNSGPIPQVGCIDRLSETAVSIGVVPLSVSGWQPDIQIQSVTSTTVLVTVTQSLDSSNERLQVQVFPAHYASYPGFYGLAPTATMSRSDSVHTQTLSFSPQPLTYSLPTFDVTVRVWTADDSGRETISQFILNPPWGPNTIPLGGPNTIPLGGPNTIPLGGPNTIPLGGPNTIPLGGPNTIPLGGAEDRSLNAPILSADAQVTIYNNKGFFEDNGVETLQILAMVTQQDTHPWLTPVGQAYHVSLDASVTDPRSIAFSYLQRDVPEGYEQTVTIYFLPDEPLAESACRLAGGCWERLETSRFVENLVVAAAREQNGTYAVMATVAMPPLNPGWNLFAYPLPVTRPITAALASIGGTYSVVYKPGPDELNLFRPAGETLPFQVTAQQDLDVRQGPGAQNEIVGRLLQGESAAVLGRELFTGWWQIACPEPAGRTAVCWVPGDAISILVSATAAAPDSQGPAASNVDLFQFGSVYWIKIEGDQAVTPYLAPPRRQPDGTFR